MEKCPNDNTNWIVSANSAHSDPRRLFERNHCILGKKSLLKIARGLTESYFNAQTDRGVVNKK